MGWVLEIVRGVRLTTYITVLLSIALMSTLLVVNVSVLNALYRLYDEIAFPRSGEGLNVIVVAGYSIAPFTSIIDARTVEKRLSCVEGVERVIYEVLSMVNVNGLSMVVRGLSKEDLKLLTNYSVVKGEDLSDDCMYCVWIGAELADRLGLDVGGYIVVYSLFTSSPYVLQVRGMLDIDAPYAYELIVPIDLARAIRGIGNSYASIAVVFLSLGTDRSTVLRCFNISGEEIGLFERALIALKYIGGEDRPSVYRSAAELYMARLGLHRDVFLAVTISIVVLTTVGCYIVGNMAVVINRNNLYILHMVGLPRHRIRMVLALLILIIAVFLLPIVVYVSEYLLHIVGLRVLGYPLIRGVDVSMSLLTLLFAYIFTALGIFAVDIVGEG